jgi:hypothetical protein
MVRPALGAQSFRFRYLGLNETDGQWIRLASDNGKQLRMKSPIILLVGLSAFAYGAERLGSGLELQLPPGWKLTASGPGAVLSAPEQDVENELYVAGGDPDAKSLDDPQFTVQLMARYFPGVKATPAGPATPFQAAGGRGVLHVYDARSGNDPGRINLYLVSLNGGVAVLAAIGRPEPVARRSADLLAMASSFRGQLAGAKRNTTVTGTWTQRLSDKKLVQFSGYTSGGNSGGSNSQKALYLAANGRYAFRSASSVSISIPGASASSAGQTTDEGKWRVVEQQGQELLELTSAKGATERIVLSTNGTQTLLNGRRWFVVGINE